MRKKSEMYNHVLEKTLTLYLRSFWTFIVYNRLMTMTKHFLDICFHNKLIKVPLLLVYFGEGLYNLIPTPKFDCRKAVVFFVGK